MYIYIINVYRLNTCRKWVKAEGIVDDGFFVAPVVNTLGDED